MSDHRAASPGPSDPSDDVLCADVREQAAVSVLARREPSADVLAHLALCPPCHDEYLGLAALAPLLETARETRPDAGTRPPTAGSALLDRLVAQVRRRRRRRRVAAAGLMLVAAAAVAGLLRVALPGTAGDPVARPRVPDAVAVGTAGDPAGDAWAQVWVRPWGTGSAVTVWVRGVHDGRCRLVVHVAAGDAEPADEWTMHAPDSGYTEQVPTAPGDIRRVELVDAGTGQRIVDVPVRPV